MAKGKERRWSKMERGEIGEENKGEEQTDMGMVLGKEI